MLDKEASGAISHFLADLLGGSAGASDEGHHLLRKAAHFCEFASLGAVFFLWTREAIGHVGTRILLCALMGVSVPLIDETIQIFSGRGPALSDVWLDIAGYVTGAVLTFAVILSFLRSREARVRVLDDTDL